MEEGDRWLFLPSLRQPAPCSRRRETSAAVCCKGEIFRPHTTCDSLECYHVFRVHVIKQRVRHFIGLLRALRLCSVHSHGFNVRRVLRVLREPLLPRWPRLSRAEFVLGATWYEPAARKGVECRLGGSIIKIASRLSLAPPYSWHAQQYHFAPSSSILSHPYLSK